eukprot:m.1091529 g.1091529  ORF g.1091529 m.1091529 type:complete len:897 (-) comp24289_c0_seq1:203-2893(-)
MMERTTTVDPMRFENDIDDDSTVDMVTTASARTVSEGPRITVSCDGESSTDDADSKSMDFTVNESAQFCEGTNDFAEDSVDTGAHGTTSSNDNMKNPDHVYRFTPGSDGHQNADPNFQSTAKPTKGVSDASDVDADGEDGRKSSASVEVDSQTDTTIHPLEAATLEQIVKRLLLYFRKEPNEALMASDGVRISRLGQTRRKSFSGFIGRSSRGSTRRGSMRQSNSARNGNSDEAEAEGNDNKVELVVRSVATGRVLLPDARKNIKALPHEERMEFEWQVLQLRGFPADIFKTLKWFTTPEVFLQEILAVLADTTSSVDDIHCAIAAITYWATGLHGVSADDVDTLNDTLAPCLLRLQDRVDSLHIDLEPLKRGFRPTELACEIDATNESTPAALSALQLLYPDVDLESAVDGDIFDVLFEKPPLFVAEQLSLLDTQLFSRFSNDEFRLQTKASARGELLASTIGTTIAYSNSLALQIVKAVLELDTAERRAEGLEFVIEVGKYLLELNNLQSLFAMFGVLSHSAIGRLKQSFGALSKSALKGMAMMKLIVSPDHNHETYRHRIRSATTALPYLGVVLKDLTSLLMLKSHTGEDSLINLHKFRKIADVIKEVTESTKASHYKYTAAYQPDHAFVQALLALCHNDPTDRELYETSLQQEPRESNSMQPAGGGRGSKTARTKSMSAKRTRRATLSSVSRPLDVGATSVQEVSSGSTTDLRAAAARARNRVRRESVGSDTSTDDPSAHIPKPKPKLPQSLGDVSNEELADCSDALMAYIDAGFTTDGASCERMDAAVALDLKILFAEYARRLARPPSGAATHNESRRMCGRAHSEPHIATKSTSSIDSLVVAAPYPVLQEEDETAEVPLEPSVGDLCDEEPYEGEIDWDTDLAAIESTEV